MLPFASFKPREFRLKGWQWLLLLLLIVCGIAFSIVATHLSVVWDETPHLEGGLLIYQGKFGEYLTFTRYPPLLDAFTAGYFEIFGANVFAARLVSITFSLLTISAVFALASKSYGRKVAFVSCAILATMPGFVWLSAVSLLEISIEFFFVATLLLFLYWLQSGRNSTIALCGLLLGVAALAKYQVIVAGLVMVVALPLLLYQSKFKAKISRFPILIIGAASILAPVIVWIYSSGILWQWIGLLQTADTQANVYSARFPLPIFYMLEMTVPVGFVHPINLIVIVLGILGLGFLVWRRKPEDKLMIVWFAVVYIFFTFVGTKSWRYLLPVFPVLAISAASLLIFLHDKITNIWKSAQTRSNRKLVAKVLAVFLIVFSSGALVASTIDAYYWVSVDSIYVPLPKSVEYVANGFDNCSESVMIVCGTNTVNQKATDFYLKAYESKPNQVWLYPLEPADAYPPNFNITQMIELCKSNNVKFLILSENKDDHYYNSNVTTALIVEMMINSGKVYYQTSFGVQPNRIFVFQVNTTALQN